MDNNQEGGINRLEKKLYGPGDINPEKHRAELHPLQYDVTSAFESANQAPIMRKEKDVKTPILRTLLIVSAIFFLSAVGISLYFVLGGANIISSDNIDLTLSGPVSVKGGDEFDLQVIISNKNNIPLQYAQLIVEYPEGSQVPKSDSTVPNRYIKDLGVIPNNSVVNETVKSVLFGEENSQQEVKVTLEYRTQGSNATFLKTKSYKTFISSSPLSLSLDLPNDTTSDKQLAINVKVNSNSSEVTKDVILQVDYPAGFIFKDANPPPTYGDSMWALGDFLAKGSRSIQIQGTMQGQDGETKTFRANVGTRSSKDDNKISLVYGSSLKSLTVAKPSISVGIVLNGDAANTDYAASSGDTIRGDISWTNNLPVKIMNGQVTMKINGQVVNKATVFAGRQGFFQSSTGVITWDKFNGNFPQSIEPGASGDQTFSFNFLPLISGGKSVFNNPTVDLEATFTGTSFVEGSKSGTAVESIIKRKIKLSSDLQLTARTVYYVGPFKNTGQLPPKVDNETTYTIMWSLVNSSNEVSAATIKASLPSYVRWIGAVSPASENIKYNPLGGEVVWNVGDVSAGSGVTSQAREVAFQVGFTPSISQAGQYPDLVTDATVSGSDLFTGLDISIIKRALNIQLTTDPGLQSGDDGTVVK